MEHLLEWHLIYRDESGMRRLAPDSSRIERIWTDATGVNVFMQLHNT
jgi:extracellular factor (EF) 3-hydroxypalmitic acid methyl ester biosynthesis protein